MFSSVLLCKMSILIFIILLYLLSNWLFSLPTLEIRRKIDQTGHLDKTLANSPNNLPFNYLIILFREFNFYGEIIAIRTGEFIPLIGLNSD